MEIKIDKKCIDEAVQKAVEEIKQNGILVPDGMTNGEVIQALFPNVSKYNNMLLENHSRNILFDDDWWNTPYKAEKETDK